jgi:hypothetical protein
MNAERAFMHRNLNQRKAAEAKSLEEATHLIRAQTSELNAASDHNEKISAELADLKAKLVRLMPELRERVYSPLWDFAHTSVQPQGVPNSLWLVTSLALLAAGIWMVF